MPEKCGKNALYEDDMSLYLSTLVVTHVVTGEQRAAALGPGVGELGRWRMRAAMMRRPRVLQGIRGAN